MRRDIIQSMPEHVPEQAADDTSHHLGRARAGDTESLRWLIERFTPLLLTQARLCLGKRYRRIMDPEDLVQEVWGVALPRLAGLAERDGRCTPVVMRFLATTLRYRVSNLHQKLGGRPAHIEGTGESSRPSDPIANLTNDTSGVVTHAVRQELKGRVFAALEELEEESRAIVISKGFEQRSNQEIAQELGLLPNTVAVKYRRALLRLRELLPQGVFGEFLLEDEPSIEDG